MSSEIPIKISADAQSTEIRLPTWRAGRSNAGWSATLFLASLSPMIILRISGEPISLYMILGIGLMGGIVTLILNSSSANETEKIRFLPHHLSITSPLHSRAKECQLNQIAQIRTKTYDRERKQDLPKQLRQDDVVRGSVIIEHKAGSIECCQYIRLTEAERVAGLLTQVLEFRCQQVETIVFGPGPTPGALPSSAILYNPELSKLTLPFSRLRSVRIYPESCDAGRIDQFITYLDRCMASSSFKRHLEIHIYGGQSFSSRQQDQLKQRCKRLHLHGSKAKSRADVPYAHRTIRTVFFGTGDFRGINPITALQNPDVLELPKSLPKLTCIKIHIDSADVRCVERFFTYLLSALGQRHLKRHVTVELYGNPRDLQANLKNLCDNLCRRVSAHDASDIF